MKKNSKAFVKSMIIMCVVGLSVLMLALFIGISYFIQQTENTENIKQEVLQEQILPHVEYTSTKLVVVEEITDSYIKALDIDRNQIFNKNITEAIRVTDRQDRSIPITTIKKGDIVEIIYQEDKDKIISISKTHRGWTKNNISDIRVDVDNRKLYIGNNEYSYTSDVMVMRETGTETNTSFISPYDLCTIQGIENEIWSIKIVKPAGSIKITNLPTDEGMLEIDRNRMIPLKDLVGSIDVVAGAHKILIQMNGYDVFAENINVEPGEVYEISLEDVEKSYTELTLITNVTGDYTLTIGDMKFRRGDEIAIAQGSYDVSLKAQGYKIWKKKLLFDGEKQTLKVNLESEKTEEESTSSNLENDTETNNMRTINISTDPIGAKVYINGALKGTTPYNVTLPLGDYTVLLEKEGYQVYSTSIMIDNSDSQNNFLYVLTPLT